MACPRGVGASEPSNLANRGDLVNPAHLLLILSSLENPAHLLSSLENPAPDLQDDYSQLGILLTMTG